MKIVLDNIIFSIQHSGGISVVWRSIINALLNNCSNEVTSLEYEGALDNICRQTLNLTNVEARKSRLSFGFERYFDVRVSSQEPFIFHSSYYRICNNKNAINITTVHDFTYERYRKGLSKQLHCWQKYRAIRKSDIIVCITENTKRDLLQYLPDVNPAKIKVIYNGVSNLFHPLSEKPDTGLGKYAIFIGWRVNYKNFDLAVRALKGTGIKLAVVGAPLSKSELTYLDDNLGPGNYRSFVRISDEELNLLYNSAFCLLYPSEYEGFGIPILEAQRCGCPVIAYNGSSIPEVIGETPLLLNELTVEEIQSKFLIIDNPLIRKQIVDQGIENSARFSWKKTGEEYLDLYSTIMS